MCWSYAGIIVHDMPAGILSHNHVNDYTWLLVEIARLRPEYDSQLLKTSKIADVIQDEDEDLNIT